MNNNLYDKNIPLPEPVKEYLQKCFDAAIGSNDSTEGYRRNKELRESGYTTYQQLKRIKNFFDNFNGQRNDLSYILNGGDYVKNWVNQTLSSWRDDDERTKEIRSTVMDNQFIQSHEKNTDLSYDNRPGEVHGNVLAQHNVTEQLKRINDLIKKII